MLFSLYLCPYFCLGDNSQKLFDWFLLPTTTCTRYFVKFGRNNHFQPAFGSFVIILTRFYGRLMFPGGTRTFFFLALWTCVLLEFSSGTVGWCGSFSLLPIFLLCLDGKDPFYWRIVWLIAGNWETDRVVDTTISRGGGRIFFRLIWTASRLFVQRHRGRLIDTIDFVSSSLSLEDNSGFL